VIKSTRRAGSVKMPAPGLSLSARGMNVYLKSLVLHRGRHCSSLPPATIDQCNTARRIRGPNLLEARCKYVLELQRH